MLPDPIEIACGFMIGRDPNRPIAAIRRVPVRSALEAEITRALMRPPCVVSFSGGRDSSAILCLATAIARRNGFDDPVPATLVFDDDASREIEWQELVLTHLGIRNWERVTCGPELEVIGPVAAAVAERAGLLFPPNAYLHDPLFRVATGGSLLTGFGGDEVFEHRAALALRAARGLEPWSVLTAKRLAHRALPRHRRERARRFEDWDWLTSRARDEARSRTTASASTQDLHWGRALRRWPASRYYQAVTSALAAVAAPHDAQLVCPFIEPPVLGALAARGGVAGLESRAAALHEFFGDVLPRAICDRTTKAVFNGAMFGPASRAVASSGIEGALDPSLVHPGRVRDRWLLDGGPDGRTLLLLQQAAFGDNVRK